MDFQKLTADASDFFARTGQKLEETFKATERTPLDTEVEELHKTLIIRRDWAKALLSLTINMVQPNPAVRMEDALLSTFNRFQSQPKEPKERCTAAEQLGDLMTRIATELGVSNSSSSMFSKCGEVQNVIGSAERDMMKQITDVYVSWLRELLANVTAAEKDWSHLDNARLDLDLKKKNVIRSKEGTAKAQIESELQNVQSIFDRQTTVTKTSFKNCIAKFDDHQRLLRDFMQAQRSYFEKCVELISKAAS